MFPFGMSDKFCLLASIRRKAEESHALLQGRKQRRKPHLVARKRSQYLETVILILSLKGATDQKMHIQTELFEYLPLCITPATMKTAFLFLAFKHLFSMSSPVIDTVQARL